jgi:hypothetical protein
MLRFTAIIVLYCYVDEIVMVPVQDSGKKNVNNYQIDASGGHGGTYGGGGGGGIVFVGDRTEKPKMKYEDEEDDGPGRFETTQKKGKYWLKCWTNTVILSPGQCKDYRSQIVSYEPQN